VDNSQLVDNHHYPRIADTIAQDEELLILKLEKLCAQSLAASIDCNLVALWPGASES
jgi:hypothetical protein